jgi:hypothetical protein
MTTTQQLLDTMGPKRLRGPKVAPITFHVEGDQIDKLINRFLRGVRQAARTYSDQQKYIEDMGEKLKVLLESISAEMTVDAYQPRQRKQQS